VLQKNSSGIAIISGHSSSFYEILLLSLKVVPFTCAKTPFSLLIPFIPFFATVKSLKLVEEVFFTEAGGVGGFPQGNAPPS